MVTFSIWFLSIHVWFEVGHDYFRALLRWWIILFSCCLYLSNCFSIILRTLYYSMFDCFFLFSVQLLFLFIYLWMDVICNSCFADSFCCICCIFAFNATDHHHPFFLQYFGPEFVHDGNETPISPPQYVDPYALLEEERIYKTAPLLNWRISTTYSSISYCGSKIFLFFFISLLSVNLRTCQTLSFFISS